MPPARRSVRRYALAFAFFSLSVPGALAQGVVVDPVTVCFEGTENPELDVFYCSQAIDGGMEQGRSLATLYGLRGRAYTAIARYDRAIADFDLALRLNPLSALAHNNRGLAHHAKGDYRAALPDFDAAVELFPRYYDAFRNRGTARFFIGEFDAAVRDYDIALRLFDGDPAGYVLRGLAHYFADAAALALADLNRAQGLAYPYPYLPLWQYLASLRAGRDGRAALIGALEELEGAAWPAPLIANFLGQSSEAALMTAVAGLPLGVRVLRRAQVDFFLGERARARGDGERARRHLEAAVTADAPASLEGASARAALGAMQRRE